VIFFLGPIFKVMIGSIILNESFTILDGFYSILCFVGLVLVAKPSFLFNQVIYIGEEFERSFAISCALAASLMSAMAYITVRKVGQDTHVMVHVVYFGIVASLISFLFLVSGVQAFVTPKFTWHELGLIVLNGVLAFLGQFFLNKGLV
jgi:drug/metabolite transporter (DMT)-like permease